jgi:hypothetical protein
MPCSRFAVARSGSLSAVNSVGLIGMPRLAGSAARRRLVAGKALGDGVRGWSALATHLGVVAGKALGMASAVGRLALATHLGVVAGKALGTAPATDRLALPPRLAAALRREFS